MSGIMGDPHLPREPMGDRGWHGKKRKRSKWEPTDDSWRAVVIGVLAVLAACIVVASVIVAVLTLWQA